MDAPIPLNAIYPPMLILSDGKCLPLKDSLVPNNSKITKKIAETPEIPMPLP